MARPSFPNELDSETFIAACAAKWGIDPILIRKIVITADDPGYPREFVTVTVTIRGSKDLLPMIPEVPA